MGRLYFPEEDLAHAGVTVADLAAPVPARIAPLLSLEADRAREGYRAGEELIHLVNEDSQPGLWVLITIYRRLLEKIASRQYDVFTERVSLSLREKLTVLARGYVQRM